MAVEPSLTAHDLPEGMPKNGRPVDDVFEPDELLFRRIMPVEGKRDVSDEEIGLDAIDLPDMSVNRSKYGPKEWLLIRHPDAGILSFPVKAVPQPRLHLGTLWYSFFSRHRPEKLNYTHTQVEAYESKDGPLPAPLETAHVDGKKRQLDRAFVIRWRYQLLIGAKIEKMPAKKATNPTRTVKLRLKGKRKRR